MDIRQVLGALVLLSVAPAQCGAAAETFDAERFAPLFERLSVCQSFNLTADGYLRIAPSRFYLDTWTVETVRDMAEEARTRPDRDISLRATVHLQVSAASSLQAATAYDALAAFMAEGGVPSAPRAPFIAAATAAYRKALDAGGYAGCFVIKWGNRRPDFFAQPLRSSTWSAIRALFTQRLPARFPFSPSERNALASGKLTEAEIVELRAIRIAAYLFENEFETLRNDRGGWRGNFDGQPMVCTDEAATFWAFIDTLERERLLVNFSTQDNRFVHRSPLRLWPADHFGVLLRNRRTEEYFVFDSWVEDGGLPPHVTSIDAWFDRHERVSIVSIGDERLDAALAEGRITHANADGLLEALRTHLADFAPGDQKPRADGRPRLCLFGWCSAQPVDAW